MVAAAGSLAVALDAARAAPAQALKAGDEQQAFARLQPAWPGIALILLGVICTAPGPVGGVPLFGYAAIGLMLVGTLALMPRLATMVFGLLPRPRGAGARLALAQLQGAPGQAAVSLAAIVASFSLMVAMAIMVASFRVSLDAWLDRLLPADLYLRTGIGGDSSYLAPRDEARIAALPGVRRAEFLRIQQLLLEPGRPRVALFARALDRDDPGRQLPLVSAALPPRPGEPPPLWASEAMVDLYGYALGKVVEVPIAGKLQRFTVAGIWRDYARQHGTVIIERELYAALSGDRNSNDAALYLAPGASPKAIEQAIRAGVPGGANIEFGEPGMIRARSLNIFDRTFAVTYALEAVAVLIGLFGLSSSFGALVLARSREFGMLRHVGMTRRQIGAMLAAECALVSALGLVLGLALGWVISLLLIHVVNRQSFHWSMELHPPWGLLALLAAALLLLATLTALASGRRALGVDVVRAVRDGEASLAGHCGWTIVRIMHMIVRHRVHSSYYAPNRGCMSLATALFESRCGRSLATFGRRIYLRELARGPTAVSLQRDLRFWWAPASSCAPCAGIRFVCANRVRYSMNYAGWWQTFGVADVLNKHCSRLPTVSKAFVYDPWPRY